MEKKLKNFFIWFILSPIPQIILVFFTKEGRKMEKNVIIFFFPTTYIFFPSPPNQG